MHLYTFKNKILWCFDFILSLKSASKLWYEKSPPQVLPGGKKPHELYLFHTFTFLCPAWWYAVFAQPSSAQATQTWMGWMSMKVNLRGLHSTDCPPQAAEHSVCTPRLTQQLHGEQKHILCSGSEKRWFHLQIKQNQKKSWTSHLTYYISLNYILWTKEINKSRKDNEKKTSSAATLLNCLLYPDFCDLSSTFQWCIRKAKSYCHQGWEHSTGRQIQLVQLQWHWDGHQGRLNSSPSWRALGGSFSCVLMVTCTSTILSFPEHYINPERKYLIKKPSLATRQSLVGIDMSKPSDK